MLVLYNGPLSKDDCDQGLCNAEKAEQSNQHGYSIKIYQKRMVGLTFSILFISILERTIGSKRLRSDMVLLETPVGNKNSNVQQNARHLFFKLTIENWN